MRDVIKVSAVNFKAVYNNKAYNTKKIIHFIETAVRDGSDLIVFPELCLTGYDVFTDENTGNAERSALCEQLYGRSVEKITSIAKKCGVFVTFGFGETYKDKFYNSAVLISDDGEVNVYRKIHLFSKEGLFFARGSKPALVDTPWGKIGVGICYDTYNFPELLRYYAFNGARLYLNPTAMALEGESCKAWDSFRNYYSATLEYNVINTGMFIVSSNLTGMDGTSHFGGGSVVMGVKNDGFKRPSAEYLAGSVQNDREGIFTAEINLSQHNPRLFVPSRITGDVDFKPSIYNGFYNL